jgi:hypothetical protein
VTADGPQPSFGDIVAPTFALEPTLKHRSFGQGLAALVPRRPAALELACDDWGISPASPPASAFNPNANVDALVDRAPGIVGTVSTMMTSARTGFRSDAPDTRRADAYRLGH